MLRDYLTAGVVLLYRGALALSPTDGVYTIMNVNSGRYVNVDGNSLVNGGNVHQWDNPENLSTQWKLSGIGNGIFTVTNVRSGKVLNVDGDSRDNGANVHQWDNPEKTSSQWLVTCAEVRERRCTFQNVNSGKKLNVASNSLFNDGNIWQWDTDNTASQWLLFEVGAPPSPPAPPPAEATPRNVRVDGRRFIHSSTKAEIVMGGPNVVVKGPPYLPSVTGDSHCNDGSGRTCFTFNQHDIDHIKSLGWNFIRLGVVWAGAQPHDEDALDPLFLARLHDILDLTDKNGIHVMLDNHGDMVGSAGCGNGAPMWFQKKASPLLIGTPLRTGLPYSLIDAINIEKTAGYGHCGTDMLKWAKHAGDPNYNILNECCLAMNGPNPGGIGFTTISQKTMDYTLQAGPGRDDFVRFWRLMAEAVKEHPSAFAAELMNEPMSIRRAAMFDTWRAAAEAINEVIPDMSVSICDLGENSIIPDWVSIIGGDLFISNETDAFIKSSNNLFYAYHYGDDIPQSIKNMEAIRLKWDVPVFGTELNCPQFWAAKDAGISHSYWHYSSYCNTGSSFGNREAPGFTFGACILGWSDGGSSKCANREAFV